MVEIIKSVPTLTIPCPTKPELWNLFFNTLERAFVTKKGSEEHKAEIHFNLLGEKAANILIYLDDENIKEYETLKAIVLREYEPSAQICLVNFRRAKGLSNETHIQLASRLKTIF